MAYGFVPAYHLTGGLIRAREYTIASGYTTAIYAGDPVELHTDGTLTIAATGQVIYIGIFDGVQYKKSNGEFVYSPVWPASTTATEIKAYVYDDPNIVFKVESDQDTTALAAADLGLNAEFAIGTPSTVYNRSAAVIDSSTKAATATLTFRFVGSAETDGTFTAAGTPMDVYVRWNVHLHRDALGI